LHQEPLPVNLNTLAGLFYPRLDDLASFHETQAGDMPAVYRQLLAHEGHMTVTVEAHHHDQVDVIVLDRRITPSHYARKILLCRQHDHVVVQFGIMRVNYACLAPNVRAAIEQEETPLGRILIEQNVLRSIHLVSLWRVTPGRELAHFFGLEPVDGQPASSAREPTFGRTAIIYCDDEPAVELLEIVAPEGT
jgi:hypothetical protein